MSQPFVLPAEPAHDGTDLAAIAERLNLRMSDDGLRLWYQRDVSMLLSAVYALRDEQRQRFWQKEANQKLREQLEAMEREVAQQRARLAQLADDLGTLLVAAEARLRKEGWP